MDYIVQLVVDLLRKNETPEQFMKYENILELSDLNEAVDALRGALGNNPCVLHEHNNEKYFISDPDLKNAIIKLFPHLPLIQELIDSNEEKSKRIQNAKTIFCKEGSDSDIAAQMFKELCD